MEKRRHLLWIAVVCALVSIALHLYLTRQHYGLKYGEATASICNINEKLNCDAVAASSYSSFMGIPVAVWGLMTNGAYLFLLFITLLGWTSQPERTGRYTLWASSLILLGSFVMGAISATSMSVFCIFCIALYVLSLITFIANFFAVDKARAFLVDDGMDLFRESKWVLGTAVAVPVGAMFINASAVSNVTGAGASKVDQTIAEKIMQWQTSPKTYTFDDTKGLVYYKGTGAPKATLVEFADFFCPHCKNAYPKVEAFAAAHPDVKLVFKHFPLDGTCNPAAVLQGKGTGVRCQIAMTIQCEENLRQAGWKAHHLFFDEQENTHTLDVNGVLDFYCAKRDGGGDCADLRKCVEGPEVREQIRLQSLEGEAANILGTPAMYMNGKYIYGQMLPVLEGAYKSIK